MKIDLLLIDPQNSFNKNVETHLQQVLHDGELCVTPGSDDAMQSMRNVADMISRAGNRLNDIHITMDSHHPLHIAHERWFKDSAGNHPAPFTLMRVDGNRIIGFTMDAQGNSTDIGEYFVTLPSLTDWTIKYLESLAAGGRYPHCIWPYHCIIGTPGHNIVEPIMESVWKWENTIGGFANIVTKGSNPKTEHFSGVRAEVEDPNDPSTLLNTDLIKVTMEADLILVAGQASSHCVPNTALDMANSFGDDSFFQKMVFLEDGSDPVPGFEFLYDKFLNEATGRGMKVGKTGDYFS